MKSNKKSSIGKNVGEKDQLARIIVGVIFLVVGALYYQSLIGIISMLLGIILIVTAAMAWCPIYSVLNINTKKG